MQVLTVTQIAGAAFANSGQVRFHYSSPTTMCANVFQICLALKRIYIHESIYQEFRDAMVEYTKTLVSGNGADDGVTLGPIQNSMQYERVQGFFNDIEKDGLKVVVGGVNDLASPGYFITPTIIDNPKESSRIVQEEPFGMCSHQFLLSTILRCYTNLTPTGPILPVLSWSDEDDVIARANNTKMGLGASVWSSNLTDARRIASRLEAGNVWINTHLEVDPRYPFSGHKESGIGSEWAVSGLKSFCNVQTLLVRKT